MEPAGAAPQGRTRRVNGAGGERMEPAETLRHRLQSRAQPEKWGRSSQSKAEDRNQRSEIGLTSCGVPDAHDLHNVSQVMEAIDDSIWSKDDLADLWVAIFGDDSTNLGMLPQKVSLRH